jgi:hypothetical protein
VRTPLRNFEQICKDDLWPGGGGGFSRILPDDGMRYRALFEVLSTIPEEDYLTLKEEVDSFTWFIPDAITYGGVWPFFATVYPEPDQNGRELAPYAKVLYLSPDLETAAYDIGLAVAAHELAHLSLKHKVLTGAEYDQQEEEAWERVNQWGFGAEAKKHAAMIKRRQTNEQRFIEKMTAGWGK